PASPDARRPGREFLHYFRAGKWSSLRVGQNEGNTERPRSAGRTFTGALPTSCNRPAPGAARKKIAGPIPDRAPPGNYLVTRIESPRERTTHLPGLQPPPAPILTRFPLRELP